MLVPSRVDRRTAVGRRIYMTLERFGLRVGPTIRQRSAHIEAFESGAWIGAHAPTSPAYRDIRVLKDRILELLAETVACARARTGATAAGAGCGQDIRSPGAVVAKPGAGEPRGRLSRRQPCRAARRRGRGASTGKVARRKSAARSAQRTRREAGHQRVGRFRPADLVVKARSSGSGDVSGTLMSCFPRCRSGACHEPPAGCAACQPTR